MPAKTTPNIGVNQMSFTKFVPELRTNAPESGEALSVYTMRVRIQVEKVARVTGSNWRTEKTDIAQRATDETIEVDLLKTLGLSKRDPPTLAGYLGRQGARASPVQRIR